MRSGVVLVLVFVVAVFDEVVEGVDAAMKTDDDATVQAMFAVLALLAIVGVAAEFFRTQFLAILGDGHAGDGEFADEVLGVGDVLRGNLEAVEEKSGALGIEFLRAQGLEDHAERQLNGRLVFRNG
jgi:hypothetical protein